MVAVLLYNAFTADTDLEKAEAALAVLIEKINVLCSKYNVKSLSIFGSVCAKDFNELSDIDLLISFNKMNHGDYADNFFIIAEKFEQLFKRKVDLITENSLSNPYFIESINNSRKVIYGD